MLAGDAGRRSAFSPVLRSPLPPLEPPLLEVEEDDDEDEEDEVVELPRPFPGGQCSRTSPGNHATIRRSELKSILLMRELVQP